VMRRLGGPMSGGNRGLPELGKLPINSAGRHSREAGAKSGSASVRTRGGRTRMRSDGGATKKNRRPPWLWVSSTADFCDGVAAARRARRSVVADPGLPACPAGRCQTSLRCRLVPDVRSIPGSCGRVQRPGDICPSQDRVASPRHGGSAACPVAAGTAISPRVWLPGRAATIWQPGSAPALPPC